MTRVLIWLAAVGFLGAAHVLDIDTMRMLLVGTLVLVAATELQRTGAPGAVSGMIFVALCAWAAGAAIGAAVLVLGRS